MFEIWSFILEEIDPERIQGRAERKRPACVHIWERELVGLLVSQRDKGKGAKRKRKERERETADGR